VVPARLHFQKETGAWIELMVLDRVYDAENQHPGWVWTCMVGNKKKWHEGEVLRISRSEGKENLELEARWHNRDRDEILLSWKPEKLGFYEVLSLMGEMPIPPYLNREAEDSDKQNYQTVYAKNEGAIAAPTAGLHFTESVLDRLRQKNLAMAELTLHVGLGTFKPMKSEKVAGHEMHPEKVVISREVLLRLGTHQGPVVAVGTTSIRSLESLYWLGTQWMNTGAFPENLETEQPYEWADRSTGYRELCMALAGWMEAENLEALRFSTRLYLMPGYDYRIVKGLITNFHQPKSTLMVLVSSFIGENWRKVYEAALSNRYRFLSYGDSSFLMP
jgi:S-adenosylmethionine:tRNA ribosyltransferase-isomerase